jgi:hypothetical protein
MTQIDQLLTVIEAFCAGADIAEATLSSRLFSDGKRIAGIRRGSDIGVRRFGEAMRWLSDHWPEGVAWPDGVPRPVSKIPEAAE